MPIYALGDMTPDFPASGRWWVAETAVLIGRVRLLDEASVWWNAVLRGDNEWIEIGERSQVQDGAVMHTDPGCPLTIGADCVIGHSVILHGCTIGANSLIGMGAIIMNKAVIGAGSIVGAGAVVPEGKEYPERSLIVGTPAKAIKPVDEAQAAGIARGATRYVERWKEYAAQLTKIG